MTHYDYPPKGDTYETIRSGQRQRGRKDTRKH
jgi:hypothetical protein